MGTLRSIRLDLELRPGTHVDWLQTDAATPHAPRRGSVAEWLVSLAEGYDDPEKGAVRYPVTVEGDSVRACWTCLDAELFIPGIAIARQLLTTAAPFAVGGSMGLTDDLAPERWADLGGFVLESGRLVERAAVVGEPSDEPDDVAEDDIPF